MRFAKTKYVGKEWKIKSVRGSVVSVAESVMLVEEIRK
jgi:hypothetical protein